YSESGGTVVSCELQVLAHKFRQDLQLLRHTSPRTGSYLTAGWLYITRKPAVQAHSRIFHFGNVNNNRLDNANGRLKKQDRREIMESNDCLLSVVCRMITYVFPRFEALGTATSKAALSECWNKQGFSQMLVLSCLAHRPSRKCKGVLANRSAKNSSYDINLDRNTDFQRTASRKSACVRILGSKELIVSYLVACTRDENLVWWTGFKFPSISNYAFAIERSQSGLLPAYVTVAYPSGPKCTGAFAMALFYSSGFHGPTPRKLPLLAELRIPAQNLKRDVRHGVVRKPKYVSAMMTGQSHTQFDSIPAAIRFLLLAAPTCALTYNSEQNLRLDPGAFGTDLTNEISLFSELRHNTFSYGAQLPLSTTLAENSMNFAVEMRGSPLWIVVFPRSAYLDCVEYSVMRPAYMCDVDYDASHIHANLDHWPMTAFHTQLYAM
ncbi:hypothetical protein CLF_112998, partial [Clonorchis sinensis]